MERNGTINLDGIVVKVEKIHGHRLQFTMQFESEPDRDRRLEELLSRWLYRPVTHQP
jgi:hypothetical protein